MNQDEWRSACLLFSEDLAAGTVRPQELGVTAVRDAVLDRPVPSRWSRAYQQRLVHRGGLSLADEIVAPMMAARRAVLGPDAATGVPRVLLRIGGFPHHRAWDDPDRAGTEPFDRVHGLLMEAGVPYLVAVPPWVPRAPTDPRETAWRPHDDRELELLGQLRRDGVAFGVHGLDHRTRHADPGRWSELSGLKPAETEERLDAAVGVLRDEALHADVFVAPFDRFDRVQYPLLASRWSVVTGGPDTVAHLGFHRSPLWRGEAVYLPSYAPLHGRARDVLPAVRRMAEEGVALWLPVVLDWSAELEEGGEALEELAGELAGLAQPWEAFLAAVEMSGRVGAMIAQER